ncbi:MAG: transposase [Bradyrhizobium sp.]|nr:transposase [Bradyrhizobium sp.]
MQRTQASTGTSLPGKPIKNAFVETFNAGMRDELLNFFDLDNARTKVAIWVADYNCDRPHSSLTETLPPLDEDLAGRCNPIAGWPVAKLAITAGLLRRYFTSAHPHLSRDRPVAPLSP